MKLETKMVLAQRQALARDTRLTIERNKKACRNKVSSDTPFS